MGKDEENTPSVPLGNREMKDEETKGCVVWFEEDYVRAAEAAEEP